MNQTIRKVLKRRVRSCIGVAAVGVIVFIGVPLTAVGEHGRPFVPLAFLGWVTFMGAFVGLQWFAAKCPKCSRRMGQEIAMRVAFAIRGKPPNFCPYCGVSLDEPMPNRQGAIETHNPLNPIK